MLTQKCLNPQFSSYVWFLFCVLIKQIKLGSIHPVFRGANLGRPGEDTHERMCKLKKPFLKWHTMYNGYRPSSFRSPTRSHSSFSVCPSHRRARMKSRGLSWCSCLCLITASFSFPTAVHLCNECLCCSGVSAAFKAGVRGGGKRGEFLRGWAAAALCGPSSSQTVQGEVTAQLWSRLTGISW